MPSLTDHKSSTLVKLLVIADSGGGKTGALASLAKAGYNLWIIDTDNNLGILRDLLKNDPAALERVNFETCVDKLKSVNGVITPDGLPKAFARVSELLTNWPGKGPLEKWTAKDILVLDTLTTLGKASLRYVMSMVNRDPPQIQDWGTAMERLERILQMLVTPAANCHVIVNSHVDYAESAEGSGIVKGFPMSLGSKLSPRVPIYFENFIYLKSSGSGKDRKREFHTKGDMVIEGKSLPSIPATLPQDTGLAELFRIVTGGPPK